MATAELPNISYLGQRLKDSHILFGYRITSALDTYYRERPLHNRHFHRHHFVSRQVAHQFRQFILYGVLHLSCRHAAHRYLAYRRKVDIALIVH